MLDLSCALDWRSNFEECVSVIEDLAATSGSLCAAIRLFWEMREDTEHVR